MKKKSMKKSKNKDDPFDLANFDDFADKGYDTIPTSCRLCSSFDIFINQHSRYCECNQCGYVWEG